jgi:hypothetical protein
MMRKLQAFMLYKYLTDVKLLFINKNFLFWGRISEEIETAEVAGRK